MSDEHRPAIYPPPDDVERYEAADPGLTTKFLNLINDVSAREHRETMAKQITYGLAVVSLVVITLAALLYAWKVDSAGRTVIAVFVTYWVIAPALETLMRRFGWWSDD